MHCYVRIYMLTPDWYVISSLLLYATMYSVTLPVDCGYAIIIQRSCFFSHFCSSYLNERDRNQPKPSTGRSKLRACLAWLHSRTPATPAKIPAKHPSSKTPWSCQLHGAVVQMGVEFWSTSFATPTPPRAAPSDSSNSTQS